MSQQLTISSLFSALALVSLALFARAGDMAISPVANESSLTLGATSTPIFES